MPDRIVMHCPMCGVTTVGATHSCQVAPSVGGNAEAANLQPIPVVPFEIVIELRGLQELRDAVATFLHGPECDNDDCRDVGYCAACVLRLEEAFEEATDG